MVFVGLFGIFGILFLVGLSGAILRPCVCVGLVSVIFLGRPYFLLVDVALVG